MKRNLLNLFQKDYNIDLLSKQQTPEVTSSAKAAATVELTVHDYKLLALIDFLLTESFIDKDGI